MKTQLRRFSGKKILITGGTKGLGLTCARQFAEEGADTVLLTYRSDLDYAQMAQNKIREMGSKCEIIANDLSEEGASERLFESVRSVASEIDIYVHNAAATAFKSLSELKAHHIDKTMNITVKSFILNVQAATELMPRGGVIVSISGMDTLKAVPRHGLLGAAKSALETLTGYFAHELASKNIRVNCVNPGFLNTESTQKYLGPQFDAVNKAFARMVPLKREAKLEEISNVVLFLCSESSTWIVGQTLNVDGGLDFSLPM